MKIILLLLSIFQSLRSYSQILSIEDLEFCCPYELERVDSLLSKRGFVFKTADQLDGFKSVEWAYNINSDQKANAFFFKSIYSNPLISSLIHIQFSTQSDFDFLKNSLSEHGYKSKGSKIDTSGTLVFIFESNDFHIEFGKERIKKGYSYAPTYISMSYTELKDEKHKLLNSHSPNIVNMSSIIGRHIDEFYSRIKRLNVRRSVDDVEPFSYANEDVKLIFSIKEDKVLSVVVQPIKEDAITNHFLYNIDKLCHLSNSVDEKSETLILDYTDDYGHSIRYSDSLKGNLSASLKITVK